MLKPLNISAIHKKEVTLTVGRQDLLGTLAQQVSAIMGIAAEDANFLAMGRVLDHSKTFEQENVQSGAKIILTLKRKLPTDSVPKPQQPVAKP